VYYLGSLVYACVVKLVERGYEKWNDKEKSQKDSNTILQAQFNMIEEMPSSF